MEAVSLAVSFASPLIKLIGAKFVKSFKKWAKTAQLGDEVDKLVEKLQQIPTLPCLTDEYLDNPPFQKFLTHLKLAVFDAEDLLGLLTNYFLRDTVKNKRNQVRASRSRTRNPLRAVKITFPRSSVNPIEAGPSISIPEIAKQINDVVNRLEIFGKPVKEALQIRTQLPADEGSKYLNVNGPGTTSVLRSKVFGREEERHKIVNFLTDEGDNSVGLSLRTRTLAIVGHGGVGKSVLAQLVYNDKRVENHFDVQMWLRVSSILDMENVKKLTLEMLDYIIPGKYHGMENRNKMVEVLREHFESKRVLLVVDCLLEDVSSEEWETLLDPFRGMSAKILVTTRYRSITVKIGTKKTIMLDGLKGAELDGLFKWYVFGDKNPNDYSNLIDLGKEIINKLSGYPLEVKTISAVLRENLSPWHWKEVLESDEWKNPKDTAKPHQHIMSSLKISYRYLRKSSNYDLQRCFSFCSLLPRNEKIGGDYLVGNWGALNFIYAKKGKRKEECGIEALNELVSRGFLQEVKESNSQQPIPTYYVIPALLHDLARLVSSEEFLTIDGSSVGDLSRSIRYVSIITHSSYNKDNNTVLESFVNKLKVIVKNLEIEKLRTLMLIGRYDENLAKTFGELFENTIYLRAVSLSMESYDTHKLLPSISYSPVLKYLKVESRYTDNNIILLQPLSRLYQLETLDISKWNRVCNFDGCNLISLKRIYAKGTQLAMISKVGKPKSIEELWEFTVEKKPGFDIGQLGEFSNLRTSLRISNIENVDSKAEAAKAKLVEKDQLQGLSLHCSKSSRIPPDACVDIFEGFQPNSKLRYLEIYEYGGITFPRWMESEFDSLQSVNLKNWDKLEVLPPLGQLPALEKLSIEEMGALKEITCEFYGSCSFGKPAFNKLSELNISGMRSCEKWIGVAGMFPSLKKLTVKNCPMLSELPRELLSSLTELVVENCNKLVLPALPPTNTLKTISISRGLDPFKCLSLSSTSRGELSLCIKWNNESETPIHEVLDFSNLKDLIELTIEGCPIACLPWQDFRKLVLLKRLKRLRILEKDSNSSGGEHSRGIVMANTKPEETWLLPKSLELLEVTSHCITGKQLSEWLLHLPFLRTLVVNLPDITGLAVGECTSTNKKRSPCDEGLLEIFSCSLKHLQELEINGCEQLCNLDLTQVGFKAFTSLQKLTVKTKLALLSSLRVKEELDGLFPRSLEGLDINWMPGYLQTKFLSNLTSLKSLKLVSSPRLNFLKMGPLKSLEELSIEKCEALSNLEGVLVLPSLKKLEIIGCGEVAAALKAAFLEAEASELAISHDAALEGTDEKAALYEKGVPENSSLPLKVLVTDDTSFLTTEICKHLSSLEELVFVTIKRRGQQTEEWTAVQRDAVKRLTSLRQVEFRDCYSLKTLPIELCSLQRPTTLKISECKQITSLPGNGDLVLEELHIHSNSCSKELVQHCRGLRKVARPNIPNV